MSAVPRYAAVMAVDDLPQREFPSAEAFERWLETEHTKSSGVWLRIAKKNTGVVTVSAAEALEICLCFGWIDSQRNALDSIYFLQRYTPRGPRSPWSQRNRDKAEALIKEGRMRSTGLAEIERAKVDGRWDAAYPPASTAEPSDDFLAALEGNRAAKEFFSTLTGTSRYAIIFRLARVKRAETRSRKIAEFVDMLARGEAPYLKGEGSTSTSTAS